MCLRLAAFVVLVGAAAVGSGCNKDGGGTSSSAGPTAPSPSNPATPVSQNGCSATFACPNTNAQGNANPSTPTFERLTLTTGTSASCRADLFRNSQSPPIPVEFTIRNPIRNFTWRSRLGDPSLLSMTPNMGLADTAGPFQTSAAFSSGGLGGLSSGLTFSQNLILEIIDTGPNSPPFASAPALAACGVTVWGIVTPGR